MRCFIAQAERFLSAQDGTTAIEYAVIASGIAGAIIVSFNALGGKVVALWTAVAAMF